MDISSLATIDSGSKSSSSSNKLIENYEVFLGILTTQLQNQNPLEPMDASAFTEQLVQYSTVEQQIQTNANLENMLKSSTSANAAALVGYVGKTIVADGNVSTLSNSSANWKINAGSSGTAIANIYNLDRVLVATKEINISSGDNVFQWDGKNNYNNLVPDGSYFIELSDAIDANDNPIATDVYLQSEVTGVDFSGAEPMLQIGGISVSLSALRSVEKN